MPPTTLALLMPTRSKEDFASSFRWTRWARATRAVGRRACRAARLVIRSAS